LQEPRLFGLIEIYLYKKNSKIIFVMHGFFVDYYNNLWHQILLNNFEITHNYNLYGGSLYKGNALLLEVFFLINVGVWASLRVPRLISRALKLTTM
jgi:hypothetical protein